MPVLWCKLCRVPRRFCAGVLPRKWPFDMSQRSHSRPDPSFDEAQRIQELLNAPFGKGTPDFMGRRRRGRPIHGWLVIDKEPGMTSSNVVNKARHILNAQKVGHGGTLDPMATGILPLAFGEATKTVSYIMDGTKGDAVYGSMGREPGYRRCGGNVTELLSPAR